MANLQNTTINGILTANTSFTSPRILNNTDYSNMTREYSGTVSIPTSVNSATNYVDLFCNVAGYSRMYGYCSWVVYQSQIHCGSFYFQLSRYGFNIQTLTSTGTWSAEMYASTADSNHCRFYNTIGSTWGNGTYVFVLNVQGPGTFTSPYLTERVR